VRILTARENPEARTRIAEYIKARWAGPDSLRVYDDCIAHAGHPLPEWYALADGDRFVGCAGLIMNDFISRQDLWPWLCALYIEPDARGRALGATLIERARADARRAGFRHIYLCTDHVGYYEKYGFAYVGQGYHPWGEESRIYEG